MARPKSPNPPLKHTLAQAALAVVLKSGPEGVTLRAVAAAAGVSQNAPYLYYEGGAPELLATVAIRGFEDLRAELSKPPLALEAATRVRELAFRYTRFGVENDAVYRTMFHRSLAKPLETGHQGTTWVRLRELKAFAYADLVAPLERLLDEGSLRGGQDPWGAPGLAIAALAHGLVGAFIDEGLCQPEKGAPDWSIARSEMTEAVTEILLRGILADDTSRPVSDDATPLKPMRPEKDHRWKLYAETVLEFFPGDHALTIDLRAPLDGSTREALHGRGLPDSFVVLTASNPRGLTVNDSENAERTRQLKERLRECRLMWLPVDGVSPDGRHREAGVAVVLPEDEARRFARELNQSAFFAYDGSTFWLVGALVDAPSVELPSTHLRQKGGNEY